MRRGNGNNLKQLVLRNKMNISLLILMTARNVTRAHTRDAIPRASVTRSVPLRNISGNAPYKVGEKGNIY